jgi:hypothetical protein
MVANSGEASDIPKGSITVTGISSVAPSESAGNSNSLSTTHASPPDQSAGGDGSPTSSGEDGAGATGAAVKQYMPPFLPLQDGMYFTSLIVALAIAGAGFVLLL